MPEHDNLPPSLDALQRKIDKVKPTGDEEPDSAAQSSGNGQMMRAGVDLVAGAAVGTFCGYYLDRWLDTTPWFLIICFFLGFAAGFRNLMRDVDKAGNETKE